MRFAAAACSPAHGGVVDTKSEAEQAKSLVIGGTGVVGGYIVEHLMRRGERPLFSRDQSGTHQASSGFAGI
jgi:hypothetical protein